MMIPPFNDNAVRKVKKIRYLFLVVEGGSATRVMEGSAQFEEKEERSLLLARVQRLCRIG
jgi:hypothetical protein